MVAKYGNAAKVPGDLETLIGDLKLCGRREFQHLLRFRLNYQNLVKKEEREARLANKPKKVEVEKTEEEQEAELPRRRVRITCQDLMTHGCSVDCPSLCLLSYRCPSDGKMPPAH